MKSIEYYCGSDFDPAVGQELTASQYYMRKILAAKELKNTLNNTYPIDGIRIEKIAIAINDWTQQYNEIFNIYEEIE